MPPVKWSMRRCNAIAVLAVALSIASELRPIPAERPPGGSDPDAPKQVTADAPRAWSLQSGGWIIKVDGADVDVPTLLQQTEPVIRPRGPQLLSPYDQLIAHHAAAEGLDWRLVAALIFEESRFDADAVSDAGAIGLMQVRPIAAASVGARAFAAPNDNIRTGARYLRQLGETFREATGRERLALVLAAYNIGPAHVRDAQMLARRVGYEPAVWHESLELVLPLLELPRLCERLSNGCAKGAGTVAYVGRILTRYDDYRRRYGARLADLDDDETSEGDAAAPNATHAASANG